jgi:putative transposase
VPHDTRDEVVDFVDGYSRAVVHWEVRESMREPDIEIERYHRTIKATAIRPSAPATLDEAQRVVAAFVEHYNSVRLHSAIGFVIPYDKLAGRERQIWLERDRKLEAARELRRQRRHQERWAS